MEMASVTDQIYGRFVKMWRAMEQSDNVRVRYLTHVCAATPRSIIGSNLRIVCKRLHLEDLIQLKAHGSRLLRQAYLSECTEEDHIAMSLIQELRGWLNRTHTISGFNYNEIEVLLDFICTQ
jgi:hypothetical protein